MGIRRLLLMKGARLFARKVLEETCDTWQVGGPPLHGSYIKHRKLPAWLNSVPGIFNYVSTDGQTLYTTCSASGRPFQVWQHKDSSHKDALLFEESNPRATVDIALTRDARYVTINSNTRTSSEVWLVDVATPSLGPSLLRPREELVEYYVDHAHEQFYIFTNLGLDCEYKVMLGRKACPDDWCLYFKPKNGYILHDMELFQKHVVLYGLRNLVPVVLILDPWEPDKAPLILSNEDACHIHRTNQPFHKDNPVFYFSSPVHPPACLMADNGLLLQDDGQCAEMKVERISTISQPANHPVNVKLERLSVISQDGTTVPVTLVYRGDLVRRDSPSPVLVHVYGCYGENISMAYRPERVPLLSRGWVLAYCHARGGGEMGRKWYYAALRESKHKTVEDLCASVRYLHDKGYSTPALTALYGRSAGAVAVGMVCNVSPELVQAAILKVPFVNATGALSDMSSYLGVKDQEEFGYPLRSEADLKQVQSLCPYYNLKPGQDYPSVLVAASQRDPMIPFNGVEQYVARLQQCVAGHRKRSGDHAGWWWEWLSIVRAGEMQPLPRGTVFFLVDQSGSHDAADEVAEQYTFLNKALGLSLN